MLLVNWRAVFVIVGGVIIMGFGKPPEHPRENKQQASQEEIANSLEEINATVKRLDETSSGAKPCAKDEGRKASDFNPECKAAEAAADAAQAAWYQVGVGTVGTVIGLLTFGAAVAAAYYARNAASHTNEANRITREGQRPWLMFSAVLDAPFGFEEMNGGGGLRVNVTAKVKNVGGGIANSVFLDVETFNGFQDVDDRIRDYFKEMIAARRGSAGIGHLLGPQEELELPFGSGLMGDELARRQGAVGLEEFIHPLVAMVITYRDVSSPGGLLYTAKVFQILEIRNGETLMLNIARFQAGEPMTVNLAQYFTLAQAA
ncbi:hypothetical protein [Asticcacaulis taihuensis]|uniref:hypothetical protein n=1 Tax=Asticcacaulis taihuensis TaxID=260084 RepID=UPI0026ECEA94|nr:hypothetical protein [Asticcacaulis taihuensis]